MAAVVSNYMSSPRLDYEAALLSQSNKPKDSPSTEPSTYRTKSKSYLIVGAGNFGVATALALRGRYPDCKVVLVDSTSVPNPRAASHDINKIVRDDYPDPLYMRMMLEGMRRWRTFPPYADYFHATGYLRADTSGFSDQAMATYKELGVVNEARWLTVTEVREKFPPFATSDFTGVDRVFWHPDAGWVEAEAALSAVYQAAIEKGVIYRKATVQKLLLNALGGCSGVQLTNGQELSADIILLCAGAHTAGLVASSFPCNPELQVAKRVSAAGAVSFYARLSGEKKARFSGVPVLKNCLKQTKGEAMSMTPEGIIKFNVDLSFTNLQYHQDSRQKLSMPPSESSLYAWSSEFPETLVERCERTMKGLYGQEVEDVRIEGYRICWDAVTPLHDFLISHHPRIPNLAVATGGSFHGWKFLPIIGEYVVKMLDRELPAEYQARWGWDAHLHVNASAQAKMVGNGYTLYNGDDFNVQSINLEDGSGMSRPTVMANPTYKTQTDLAELLENNKGA